MMFTGINNFLRMPFLTPEKTEKKPVRRETANVFQAIKSKLRVKTAMEFRQSDFGTCGA
jgi:hypothetical protein